jgi:RimJ/RimL family protein N-acetyltransferase
MKTEHWPLFGLRVETPSLTLRYPDDDDAAAMANLAAEGIHDPGWMPFSFPWTDSPPPMLQRGSLQHIWRTRAEWTPLQWHLPMAVVVDGDIVGVQAMLADQFPTLRTVSTGSWLGRRYQGKGIGTEMRSAILHLAFAGLGAHYAQSRAFIDNDASIAVTRRLGYEDTGRELVVRREAPAWMLSFRLPRSRWEQRRREEIVIVDLDACLELFGAR